MLQVLAALVAEEAAVHHNRALERRIQRAKLPPEEDAGGLRFHLAQADPKAEDPPPVRLRFRGPARMRRVHLGDRPGKSHLLNALGYTACEKRISVRFTRVVDMINTLTTAQLRGTLERALREYTRPQLLLLDELGYLPIDKRGADLLFQVVAARYESGSVVVSTNRAFREWGTMFDGDNTLATAMIDRLMHHGEPIVIRGESYRMKDKKLDEPDSPTNP